MRAVFVIDPAGVIRTIIYYPLSLGRNFDELLRVVIAHSRRRVLRGHPADGVGRARDRPHAGSRGTARTMDDRKKGVECVDWFFYQGVPADLIERLVK